MLKISQLLLHLFLMFVNIFIHCAFICLTCCLEIDFICFRRVYIILLPSNVIFSTR